MLKLRKVLKISKISKNSKDSKNCKNYQKIEKYPTIIKSSEKVIKYLKKIYENFYQPLHHCIITLFLPIFFLKEKHVITRTRCINKFF